MKKRPMLAPLNIAKINVPIPQQAYTIDNLYIQNFEENIEVDTNKKKIIKDIFEKVRLQIGENNNIEKYNNILSLLHNPLNILSYSKPYFSIKGAFNNNPNNQTHSYKTYVFIPKNKDENVIKVYDCENTIVSEYNVIKEIVMQIYAHSLISKSNIIVPKIINYSKKTPIDSYENKNIVGRIKYIIEMEYIKDFTDLKKFLLKNVRSMEESIIPNKFDLLCEKINDGIKFFEDNGIFHNDLHYENIMVSGTLKNPKICFIDYGKARFKRTELRDYTLNPYKIFRMISKELKLTMNQEESRISYFKKSNSKKNNGRPEKNRSSQKIRSALKARSVIKTRSALKARSAPSK